MAKKGLVAVLLRNEFEFVTVFWLYLSPNTTVCSCSILEKKSTKSISLTGVFLLLGVDGVVVETISKIFGKKKMYSKYKWN